MKKNWIKFIIITLACVIISTPFICGKMYHISVDNQPTSPKNTTWISEDKTIVFSASEEYEVAGYLFNNDKKIEFFLSIDPSMNVSLYPISVLEEDYIRESERFEYWKCGYFLNENKFVAKVGESTYFQKGERITFYRLSDAVDGE